MRPVRRLALGALGLVIRGSGATLPSEHQFWAARSSFLAPHRPSSRLGTSSRTTHPAKQLGAYLEVLVQDKHTRSHMELGGVARPLA